jgi:hypothetical protein
MINLINCGTCGYPLTPEERTSLIERDGVMVKPTPMTKDEAISTERALDLALETLESIQAAYPCETVGKRITAIKQARALDKKAENARELGLDYEPVPVQEFSYKGPEELWLQLHGDCSDDELTDPVDYTDDSVTWCWHQINNSDVRYVRADIATPPNMATPLAAPAPEERKRQSARSAWVHATEWRGLTDEEIEQEFGFIDELLRDCVHRTEAKVREKNSD